MQGIGDNLYTRPFVRLLVEDGHDVYVHSVLPELYADLPVKLLNLGDSNYRTQKKALATTTVTYSDGPEAFDRVIGVFYGIREMKAYNIINNMEKTFGYRIGLTNYKMDLPANLPAHGLALPGKMAIVRPVTHRKEWLNTSRSPKPNYVGWCARMLRDAGYYVISIADTDGENEWIDGEEPIVDLKLNRGELGLYRTLSLFRDAEVVVTGSGMAVPAAIAAGANLFTIFGGRGAFDNPHKIFDLRMDMRKIYWALPDNFCRCYAMEHDCDKKISSLDDKFFTFMRQVKETVRQEATVTPKPEILRLPKRPLRVALPVGIGDCHWSVMKLRALSKYFDDRPIHAFINSGPDHATRDFLKLCPQVEETFYSSVAPYGYDFQPKLTRDGGTNPRKAGKRNCLHWAKLENCLDYEGYDVWSVMNVCVDAGLPFEAIWPELESYGGTEYAYQLNIPTEAKRYVRRFGRRPVLFYPSGVSANAGFHSNTFTKDDWAATAKALSNNVGPIVVVGSGSKNDLNYWRDGHDGQPSLRSKFDELGVYYVDAVGKTDLTQYCALIATASCWVGLNSGGGIIAASQYTPTVMIWADSAYPIEGSNAKNMDTNMQRNWLRADQLVTYRTLSFGSPQLTPENVVKNVLEVAK